MDLRIVAPRTLFGKLMMVFLTFGAAMTLAMLVVMKGTHERYHAEADQTVSRNLARRLAAANFLLGDTPATGPVLHASLARLAEANPDADFYLVDDSGLVVAGSPSQDEWRLKRIHLGPVTEFLGGRRLPVFGDDPRHPTERVIFSAAPVSIAECPARLLYVVLRRGEHEAGTTRLREYYEIGEGTGVVVLVAALAAGLTLLVVRMLTHRLSQLDTAMQRFRSTDGPALGALGPHEVVAGDEIDRLTHMCHEMSAQVRMQMAALKSNDEVRRELLANVSHDLRTPITTLQTYLETLSTADAGLSPNEQSEYIRICLTQTHRLGRLVEQLLEVAKLDARQVVPQLEVFPMAELVHDVARKFELAARGHDVKIRVDAAETGSRVNADVALIERVLDNLIDNAIRYSPSGSEITLRQTVRKGMVRVSVCDQGRGMTPAETAKIFDRFYRARSTREDQRGHAGLGLSIVKAILQLLGSTINVESAPNVGSTFWFELPVVEPTALTQPTE